MYFITLPVNHISFIDMKPECCHCANYASTGKPIWGRQDPDGSHVGPMNFAIWEHLVMIMLASWQLFCYSVCNHKLWQLKHRGHLSINLLLKQCRDSRNEDNINGLVQERCNSSANTLQLRLSCTNPSIWSRYHLIFIMGILYLGRQPLYIDRVVITITDTTIPSQ